MNLLKGITIIDFTRLLPGPVATNLLAQMGAEVIKIESPNRMDYVRNQPIMIDGASVLFHQLNHNKVSKIIDYTTPEGKTEILHLIKNADALIEQFRPGAMTAWGFGYEEIKRLNPSIIYVSLTGYGQEGTQSKEAGHDLNYLAYSGMLSLAKDEKGKPIVAGTQYADIGGAYMTVMALQAALLQKERTGEGSFIDLSLANAIMPFLAIPHSLQTSGLDHEKLNVLNGKTAVNYAVYECADGKWISLGALEMKFWGNLCDELEKPEWKRKHQLQLFNSSFPKEEVETLFQTKTRDEWTAFFKGKDVCIAPILEIEELENSPFHQTQNSFQEIETPNGTKLKTIAIPFKVK